MPVVGSDYFVGSVTDASGNVLLQKFQSNVLYSQSGNNEIMNIIATDFSHDEMMQEIVCGDQIPGTNFLIIANRLVIIDTVIVQIIVDTAHAFVLTKLKMLNPTTAIGIDNTLSLGFYKIDLGSPIATSNINSTVKTIVSSSNNDKVVGLAMLSILNQFVIAQKNKMFVCSPSGTYTQMNGDDIRDIVSVAINPTTQLFATFEGKLPNY